MDIYQYAMEMEVDGKQFYLNLAKKTNNSGIKNILTMLADSEAEHYNVILRMQKGDKTHYSTDTEILTKAKNVFMKMKEEKEFDIDISQVEIYKKALDIEKKSEGFYLEKAGEEEDPYKKEIMFKLANEEKKHCVLMENIINFITQPDTWLENAEWYHLKEN